MAWQRHNAEASTGYVHWPWYLNSTKEGGMCVWLVFFEEKPSFPENDPFEKCADVPLYVDTTGSWNVINNELLFYPDGREKKEVLAAVCLGTTGGSFCLGEPWASDLWLCGRSDLSVKGQALVDALEALYDRPGALLTCLDT